MPSKLAVLLIGNILPGDSRYGQLWWGFPGSERKYHLHSFFREKEFRKFSFFWIVCVPMCTTEYQGACGHQSKRCYIKLMRASGRLSEQATWSASPPCMEQVRKGMAMEDVPAVSVSILFYFQSWFIVVEVCDFFAPTTFCREVCACVCASLFDWTQLTYAMCVVNRVRVNWNPPEGLFNSFFPIPLESILTTTISLDGVCESQLLCIGSSLSLQAWIM